MPRDLSQPSYGQVWQYQGEQVFILGNGTYDDGLTIWAARRITGERVDATVAKLIPTAITSTNTFGELTRRCAVWARAGNADAAWWLGWRFDGVNLPKSLWYYLAAIRKAPRAYGWYLSNLFDNALYGIMCEGEPQAHIGFIKDIAEFNDRKPSTNWQDAIALAENAVHIPSTLEQVEAALLLLSEGQNSDQAAWNVAMTCQGLTFSAEYKKWSAQRASVLANEPATLITSR